MLFIVLSVLYFVSVFYFRNKLSKASKKLKEKKTEFSPIVSEFLFYDETDSKTEKSNYINLKIQIRELLKDKYNRKVLTDVLLDLRKDVSGQTQINLFELYQNLELHKDAYIKLKSWKWQIVTSGILELTKMQVSESYSFLIKFINDKRPTIRKHAEIAVVTLDDRGISYFLDTTKYRISEWQQLKLLDVLRNKENFEIPKFKLWLTSKNKHVVLFALRLIKYYNQNDATKSLIPLIKHKSNQIKQEAINCIEEFYVEEAIDTLKLVFWKSSEDVKMSILSAIATIGTENDLDFLVEIEQRVRSFAVRSKAISTINEIAPETILPSDYIEKDTAFENTIPDIIEHEDAPEISISDQLQQKLEEQNAVEEVKENNTDEIIENHNDIVVEVEEKKDNIDEVLTEKEIEEDLELTEVTKQEDVVESETGNVTELPIEIEEESVLEENINQNEVLQNIEVVAESIAQNQEQMDINRGEEEMNEELEISLDFLPLVIEEQEEKSIQELKVGVEDEVIVESRELDLNFLPLVIANTEDFVKHSATSNPEEITNQKVDSNEPEFKDSIDFMELDFLPLVEEHAEPNKEKASNKIDDLFDFIPKPHQISDEESDKLLLLADIEEFGDAREIPLLDEYLADEKSPFLIERIEEIMEEIVKRTPFVIPKEKEEPIEDSSLVRGFISEIFANQDVESQLILLKEIAIVGDEKEAAFLRTLIKETSEAVVVEKANEALTIIKDRLSIEAQNTNLNEEPPVTQEVDLSEDEKSEETDSMFDVNFELSPNTEDVDITLKTEKKKDNKSTSFGSQLSEISKRIKDILNGQ